MDPEKMDVKSFWEYRGIQTIVTVDSKIDEGAIPRLQDLQADWESWVVPVDKEMTLEKLSEKYETMKRAWEASDNHHTLLRAFENTVLKQKNLHITACMCLGLGPMNCGGLHRSQDGCNKSMSQLIRFESWISLLSEPLMRNKIR